MIYRPECFAEPIPSQAYLGEFGWCRASAFPVEGGPWACHLSDDVFDRLTGYIEDGETDDIRCYLGRIAAEEALVDAIEAGLKEGAK